jgi:(E)-4-hydroxy-3-methylbut-2-enyl-diphosphate synthase
MGLNSLAETLSKKYCNSLTEYSRYKTREVKIGYVPMGGDNPIRVQSMTTTDTMDTIATVKQSIRIIEAGSDYVRITAPALKEAVNLENIKKELRKRGYGTPLIADIHFTPNAAERAARVVEKVRVNPGNYADRKKFKIFQYTDEMYESELERIRERFTPLVKVCKEYGTAMRIGTNHGSLSDRIMNRYGDTPLGMVESALEFVRICEDLDYHEIVLSMKASNPQVMIQAYRLLIAKMEEESMNYPLHLGVTEAGDGEDGRIKSAVGIGALLEDGIGDTIRVSLTEEPEAEIPVAINLVKRYNERAEHQSIPYVINNPIDPFERTRRNTSEADKIGGKHVPVVIMSSAPESISKAENLSDISYVYSEQLDKWNIGDTAPDFIYLGTSDVSFALPGTLKKVFDYKYWRKLENKSDSFPLFTAEEYIDSEKRSDKINFLSASIDDLNDELYKTISGDKRCVIVLNTNNKHGMAEQRRVFIELVNRGIDAPVIIKRMYENIPDEDLMLYSATDMGALLTDGLGDGIWIEAPDNSLKLVNSISFGILQATRTRISRTEYISCPSCGRTQFDLQETTAKIRARTNHLKGVKIAIMGCIVNGPGEMADADFGYVGSGPCKISLYKGKEVVERGIDSEVAVNKLIELIKNEGFWVEP